MDGNDVSEMTDGDVLLALATQALRTPDMSAKEVIETMTALGRGGVVSAARELIEISEDIDENLNLEDHPEPDDELE